MKSSEAMRVWYELAKHEYPVNTKHLYNMCTMLDQRLRRGADVVQMIYACFLFPEFSHFNPCYHPIKSMLLGTKFVLKHQDSQMFASKFRNIFHLLKVVGRGSETQLQGGDNLNV